MKIAVTGSAGHVGGNLCRELIKRGHTVKALVHQDTRAIEALNMIKMQGSILEYNCLINLFKDTDIVFHTAAYISIDGDAGGRVWRINVGGTQNVVRACLQCSIKRLIHFSSIHAFKQIPTHQELNETIPLVDDSAFMYDQSKAESERVVLATVENGLDAVILNPSAIIGPNDFKPSRMGRALLNLYQHKMPVLVSGGFDWVDVRDVVNAAISAVDKGKSGENYLLSGTWLSLKELANLVAEITGTRGHLFTVPIWLARSSLPFIKLYSQLTRKQPLFTNESLEILKMGRRNISHEKARRELGFQPRSLKETIQDTFNWFKQAGMIQ